MFIIKMPRIFSDWISEIEVLSQHIVYNCIYKLQKKLGRSKFQPCLTLNATENFTFFMLLGGDWNHGMNPMTFQLGMSSSSQLAKSIIFPRGRYTMVYHQTECHIPHTLHVLVCHICSNSSAWVWNDLINELTSRLLHCPMWWDIVTKYTV